MLAGGMSMVMGNGVEGVSIKDLKDNGIEQLGNPSPLYAFYRSGYKSNISDVDVVVNGGDRSIAANFSFRYHFIPWRINHNISGWYKYDKATKKWLKVTGNDKLNLNSNTEEIQYYQHQTSYYPGTRNYTTCYSNVVKVHFVKNEELATSIELPEYPNRLYSLNIPTSIAIKPIIEPEKHTSHVKWEIIRGASLATIDDQGFITANSEYKYGTANVRASIDGKSIIKPYYIEPAVKNVNVKAGQEEKLSIEPDILKNVSKVEWYKVMGKKKRDKNIFTKKSNGDGTFDYRFKAEKKTHEGLYYAKVFYADEYKESESSLITNQAKITVVPDPNFKLNVHSSIQNCTFKNSVFDDSNRSINQVAQNDELLLTLDVNKKNKNSENKSGMFAVKLPNWITIDKTNGSYPEKTIISDNKLTINDFKLTNDNYRIQIYFTIKEIPANSSFFEITNAFIDNDSQSYSDESSPITMNFVQNNFIAHSSNLNFGKINAFSEMLELPVQGSDNQKAIFSSEDQRRIKGRASLSVKLINDFSLDSKQEKTGKRFEAYLRYYDKNNSKNFKTIGNNELILDSSTEEQSFTPRVFNDQLRLFIKKNPFAAGNFQGTIQWTLGNTDSL